VTTVLLETGIRDELVDEVGSALNQHRNFSPAFRCAACLPSISIGIFTQEKGQKWGFSNANGERKANFRGISQQNSLFAGNFCRGWFDPDCAAGHPVRILGSLLL